MSSGQGKLPLEVVTDNALLRSKYESQELDGLTPLYVTTLSAQGVGISVGGAPAALLRTVGRNPGTINIRPIGDPGWANFTGLSYSFRQIFQIPVSGLVAVRARYETDATAASTVASVALAAGRSIAENNPKGRAGEDTPWAVFSNIAVSAASAALGTDAQCGSGYTPWAYLDVPEAIDGGVGGYIYTGTTGSNGRLLLARPNRYSLYANPLFVNGRYRCLYANGVNYVSSNQSGFPAGATDSQFNPVAELQIIPVKRILTVENFGDSTTEAIGDTPGTLYPWGTRGGVLPPTWLRVTGLRSTTSITDTAG